jgi:hypothetical protein
MHVKRKVIIRERTTRLNFYGEEEETTLKY